MRITDDAHAISRQITAAAAAALTQLTISYLSIRNIDMERTDSIS